MKRTVVVVVALALFCSAVVMTQGRKIAGVVVSASTSQPVAGAEVRYAEDGETLETTRTDDKGNFEISNASGGIVTVTADRYATTKRSWPPREGVTLRFELTPPATASGTLVDLVTGRGVPGHVELLVHHPLNSVSSGSQTRGGAFRFNDLPAGPAVIFAHADGFAPYFSSLTIEAGKHHDTRLGLLLEAAASGKVVDRNGTAVYGARVHARYDRTVPGRGVLAGLVSGDVTSNPDGSFRVGGLLPDTTVELLAEYGGQLSEPVAVRAGPGMQQTGVELRLP